MATHTTTGHVRRGVAWGRVILATQPGRNIETLFATIANVYYEEKEVIGRAPKFCLESFGTTLGLTHEAVGRLRNAAMLRAEMSRRLLHCGAASSTMRNGHARAYRYVMPDGRLITR